MRINHSLPWLVFIAGTLVLTSCSRGVRHKSTGHTGTSVETVEVKKGPPPHAPAHGYRHKHGDVVLAYESDLGIYVVVGHEGYYFHKGDYYRSHKGKWQTSADVKGPWKKISDSKLPNGLNKNQHAKANKKTNKKK